MSNREYVFFIYAFAWLISYAFATLGGPYYEGSVDLLFVIIGYFGIAGDDVNPKFTNWLNKRHSVRLY